jgi:hypothetical protein
MVGLLVTARHRAEGDGKKKAILWWMTDLKELVTIVTEGFFPSHVDVAEGRR